MAQQKNILREAMSVTHNMHLLHFFWGGEVCRTWLYGSIIENYMDPLTNPRIRIHKQKPHGSTDGSTDPIASVDPRHGTDRQTTHGSKDADPQTKTHGSRYHVPVRSPRIIWILW